MESASLGTPRSFAYAFTMSDCWQQVDGKRLVTHSGHPIGRYLIGVPFLLGGAWFLYKYLVLGIVEYIHAGDWRGLFTGVFGWLVIVLMGAVFLVPGWVLCFFRRVVLIDANAGGLVERQDFRVLRRDTAHKLDAFNRVVILAEPVKGSTTGNTLHTVYLYRADESSVLVGVMDHASEAAKLGEAVSRMLGLPITSASLGDWENR